MGKLIWMLSIVFLLLFWLIYRETRHRQNYTNSQEKRDHAFPNAQSLLKDAEQGNAQDISEGMTQSTEKESEAILNSLTSMTPSALVNLKIIEPGMISEETLAYTTKIIDSIKRPHPAMHSLTSNISPEELIDIVQGCPDITAKILTTVNSASFGLLSPITSINHAVIYLGMGIVKSITIQLMIKDSLSDNTPEQEKAYKKLWAASYLNSSLSFLLAQCLSNPQAPELSTKSLLDNVGCFALLSFDESLAELYLEEPSLLNRTLIEQEKYGLNASVVGYYLTKKWQLPTVMSESISNNFLCLHYENKQKKRSIKETQDLIFCYFMGRLANYLVYNNIKDITEFDLNACHNLDFFYIQQALKENDLNTCLSMMRSSTFINKANKIIQQI